VMTLQKWFVRPFFSFSFLQHC